MNSRQTDTVTRVDIRIPNHLYSQIQEIAIAHYNAKIHHRSNKPEITPTILELIQIGIAHIESSLPVTDESVTDDLKRQIKQLDGRLSQVEKKLQKVEGANIQTIPEIPLKVVSKEGLSDSELSRKIGISSSFIYRYRRDGKADRRIADRLKDWTVEGDRWVEKIRKE